MVRLAAVALDRCRRSKYPVIHYPTPAEHIPKTTTRRKSEGT